MNKLQQFGQTIQILHARNHVERCPNSLCILDLYLLTLLDTDNYGFCSKSLVVLLDFIVLQGLKLPNTWEVRSFNSKSYLATGRLQVLLSFPRAVPKPTNLNTRLGRQLFCSFLGNLCHGASLTGGDMEHGHRAAREGNDCAASSFILPE